MKKTEMIGWRLLETFLEEKNDGAQTLSGEKVTGREFFGRKNVGWRFFLKKNDEARNISHRNCPNWRLLKNKIENDGAFSRTEMIGRRPFLDRKILLGCIQVNFALTQNLLAFFPYSGHAGAIILSQIHEISNTVLFSEEAKERR